MGYAIIRDNKGMDSGGGGVDGGLHKFFRYLKLISLNYIFVFKVIKLY